ncbi:MAG: amidohydrolase family protein [Deltaproteobacteria bacterium]|nr:amidohydrolase family protein [Deltaproteobacteria bacterium]
MVAPVRLLCLVLCLVAAAACRKHQPRPANLPPAPAARGPVIDSHTLISPLDETIDTALKLFERVGVVKFCNKNGGFLGSRVFAATLHIKHRLKERFEFFANVSWARVEESGWGDFEAERFAREVGFGAKGIKFFKAMGLGARDADEKLIRIDDARFAPIMATAAKLNAVVAIHVGDPKAFFEPPTPQNERWDELQLAPDWSFFGQDYPPLLELWKQTERLVSRHPDTTFLFIHLGMAEDIGFMEKLLDAHPNVYLDTSARVPEFGRHPVEKLRRFFIKFQDRILFGTDLAIGPDYWQLGSVSETPVGFEDAVKF